MWMRAPDRSIFCGLAPPSSVTLTVPVNEPYPTGANVTVIVQDRDAPRMAGQVLVSEKYCPLIVILEIFSAVVLEMLVRVLESVPLLLKPKLRLAGLNPTTVPAPLRLTVCGLPGALSVIESVPLKLPIAFGVKVTWIVQLAPEARFLPQVCVCLKPSLVMIPVRLSGWVP